MAINVGTVLDGGSHFPLPQDVENQLINADVKWLFVRSILWHKVTAGAFKRNGFWRFSTDVAGMIEYPAHHD